MVNRVCVVCHSIKLQSCPSLLSTSLYFSPMIKLLFPFYPWTILQLLFQIYYLIEFLSFERGNLHICMFSVTQVTGNWGSNWIYLRLSSSPRTASQICAAGTSALSSGASMKNELICRFCVMVCAAMMID